MVRIVDANGNTVVSYVYNAWGKSLPVNTNTDDDFVIATAAFSNATIVAKMNPLRYRGYYYDTDTGFYYLQSRYYDPNLGRFINADSYSSTGQGILGNNMYAYCNNNAVNLVDATGTLPFGIGPMTVAINDGGGRTPTQRYYVSADKAALAFAQKNYKRSRSEQIEYGAYLYSVQCGDSIRYAYGDVQRGTDFDIRLDAALDKHFRFDKWVIIGIIHTHPNYSSFSDVDSDSHERSLYINPYFATYVAFGPTTDSFIIRKLYGGFDILVYPNRGGGIPGVRNTRVNAIF